MMMGFSLGVFSFVTIILLFYEHLLIREIVYF